MEDLSGGRMRASSWGGYAASTTEQSSRYGHRDGDDYSSRHYSYEDEDQSQSWRREQPGRVRENKPAYSADNIAQFFTGRGGKGVPVRPSRPKLDIPEPTGAKGFRSGQRVRHPKYGEGVVFRREGDGDDAKITVQFSGFGVKKLVEKFAQLERL
jgi:DNA helicase-2/ATP-dependent DNA helicase PcrA